jgi:hypothetical protein
MEGAPVRRLLAEEGESRQASRGALALRVAGVSVGRMRLGHHPWACLPDGMALDWEEEPASRDSRSKMRICACSSTGHHGGLHRRRRI